jgi:hypothetical protein
MPRRQMGSPSITMKNRAAFGYAMVEEVEEDLQ